MSKTNEEKLIMTSQIFADVTGFEMENTGNDLARLCLAPATGSAMTMKGLLSDHCADKEGGVRRANLLVELNRQLQEIVGDDDMERAQKLLASQAITLNGIFHNLADEALRSQRMDKMQIFLTLALKAQAQSRCAMEAISKLKNPPSATFVKQANIAAGHQQVNNYGNASPAQNDPARAQENLNPQNELLEAQHGERLDFGAQATASAINSPMETVGKINRPKNRGRKTGGKP